MSATVVGSAVLYVVKEGKESTAVSALILLANCKILLSLCGKQTIRYQELQ
jgi:hypothetical protein